MLLRKMMPTRKTKIRLLWILGLSAILTCAWSTFTVEAPTHRLVEGFPFGLDLMQRMDEIFMNFAVGGRNVTAEEHATSLFEDEFYLPYMSMISLRTEDDAHVCGGSLISPRVGLTAAHCFDEAYSPFLPMWADVGRLKRTGESNQMFPRRKISKVVIHGNYSSDSDFDSDLALVMFDVPVTGPRAILSKDADCFESAEGCNLQILGFGKLDYDKGLADHLQIVSPPSLSKDVCKEFRSGQTITKNMLCAGNITQGGISSCQGDSGGPAFILNGGKYRQVGVVSWSNGCGDAYTPEVMASVPSLLPWIEDHCPECIDHCIF